MNETLLAIYFPVLLMLAVGTFLFFRRKDPAFKKRWYRHAYALNFTVIGGLIVLMAISIGSWPVVAIFSGAALFSIWVGVFRTRVCLGCGKLAQPENLITPQKFCSKCGTGLD